MNRTSCAVSCILIICYRTMFKVSVWILSIYVWDLNATALISRCMSCYFHRTNFIYIKLPSKQLIGCHAVMGTGLAKRFCGVMCLCIVVVSSFWSILLCVWLNAMVRRQYPLLSSSCPSFFLVIIYRVDGEGGKCYCLINGNNAPVIWA